MEIPHLSKERLEKIVQLGLYENLEENELARRSKILDTILEKIARNKENRDPRILQTLKEISSYSQWAMFYAQVCYLKHITQKAGEDDYCLIYPREQTLFIAREIFLGFPEELASEFIFRSFLEEAEGRDKFLDDAVSKLVKKRVVNHDLNELIERMLDYGTELKYHEDSQTEIDSEREKSHLESFCKQIRELISRNPRDLRELVNFFKKRNSISFDELSKKLGEQGIWSSRYNQLIKEMRINLAEGNIMETAYQLSDIVVMKRYFLPYDSRMDSWTLEESQKFVKEFNLFLEQAREHVTEVKNGFYDSLKKLRVNPIDYSPIDEAKTSIEQLESLRGSFPRVIDSDSQRLVNDIDSALNQMRGSYYTELSRFGRA